jgi:FKBP-type peptidyl-prolyl cis-trans isomerase
MRRICLFALLSLVLAGCGNDDTKPGTSKEGPAGGSPKLTQLVVKDTLAGKGPKAKAGDTVYLHYMGKLGDGTEFDSNGPLDERPMSFTLGQDPPQAVEGFEKGLLGVQAGGERDIGIPSAMAYGSDPPKGIPANADLHFHVKILYVLTPEAAKDVNAEDIKIGTGPAVKNGDAVTINFTSKFIHGRSFESARDYKFEVGSGQDLPSRSGTVLLGINRGVVGMKKGGKRRLVLPPELLYGPQGLGTEVRPNDIIVFEIELVKIG